MRHDAVSGVSSISEKGGAGTEAFPSECWNLLFLAGLEHYGHGIPTHISYIKPHLSENNGKADADKRRRAKTLYSICCSGLFVGSMYQAHQHTISLSSSFLRPVR